MKITKPNVTNFSIEARILSYYQITFQVKSDAGQTGSVGLILVGLLVSVARY